MNKNISMLFNDLFDGFFKKGEATSFLKKDAHSAGIIADSVVITLSKDKKSNIVFSIWDSKQIEYWDNPYAVFSIVPHSSEYGVVEGKEGILTGYFWMVTFITLRKNKNPTKEISSFITKTIRKVRAMIKNYDHCVFKEEPQFVD